MKGILITTDNSMQIMNFKKSTLKSLQKAVGGYIESVYPKGLGKPYIFVCNEEGLIKNLPVNPTASYLFGNTIYGNVVVLQEGENEHGEWDIIGLNGGLSEINGLMSKLMIASLKGADIYEKV